MSEPFEITAPPAHISELVELCTRAVLKATGVPLDFTLETLPLLDHYLRQVPRDAEAIRALVAPAAGAYFGEVVRRNFPSRWHAPGDDFGAWRIEFEHVFLHFSPVALAHEAVTGVEVVEGGAGFNVLDQDVDAVRAGLQALGTIAEEDYFKLATRFEVLQTVVDRVMGQSISNDDGVNYSAAVYRAALDEDEGDAS